MNKQMNTYQRYILYIIALSFLSIVVYISYTDTIGRDFLPRLKSQVKMTVCSVLTLSCRLQDEQENDEDDDWATRSLVNKVKHDQYKDRGINLRYQNFGRGEVNRKNTEDDSEVVIDNVDTEDFEKRLPIKDKNARETNRRMDLNFENVKRKKNTNGRERTHKGGSTGVRQPTRNYKENFNYDPNSNRNTRRYNSAKTITKSRYRNNLPKRKPKVDKKGGQAPSRKEIPNPKRYHWPNSHVKIQNGFRKQDRKREGKQISKNNVLKTVPVGGTKNINDIKKKGKENALEKKAPEEKSLKKKDEEISTQGSNVKVDTHHTNIKHKSGTNNNVNKTKVKTGPERKNVPDTNDTPTHKGKSTSSRPTADGSSSARSKPDFGKEPKLTEDTEPNKDVKPNDNVKLKEDLQPEDDLEPPMFPLLDFKAKLSHSGEGKFLGRAKSFTGKHREPDRNLTSKRDHLTPKGINGDKKWKGKSLSHLLSDKKPFTLQSDYDYLQNYLQTGGLNLTILSQLDWETEPLDYEADLLSDPPLEDVNLAATHTKSTVIVLNPQRVYSIGDVVKMRIDVFNGRGDALKRGGDEVRVWLVERGKKGAVAATVNDLNNGSYIASVKVMWTGVQQMQVELTYPREVRRTHDYLRYITKCVRFVAAGYAKGHLSESTLCSPYHVIPGYQELCNYTDSKYGLTWYCGKPRKAELGCGDWVSIRDMEFFQPFPMTPAEQTIISKLRLPPPIRLIPKTIVLNVSGGVPILPENSCSSQNYTDTWQISKTRGFMLHDQWVRTDCKPPLLNDKNIRQCLKDTNLVFTGDSNLLMFFTVLSQRLRCHVIEVASQNWHRPRSCVIPEINFHLTWALHGYPVHPVSDHWALKSEFREVTEVIDSIPAKGKFVVLVHLYIHFSIHHYNVFINRMQAARSAIQDLIKRNPETMVIIRGPHTALYGWPPHLGGDLMGRLMRELTVRIFEGLHHRVVFLDFWDMTVATENASFHPEEYINTAMVNVLMQTICAGR